jgi:hypothetical protein
VTLRHSLFVAALAAILCAAAQPVRAQAVSITAKVAFDPSIGGTMHEGGTGVFNGSNLVVSPQSWTDTHSSQSPLFVGGIDIPVAHNTAAVVQLEYGRAGADTITMGTVNGSDLRAEFEPYKYWGLQGGVRGGGRTGPYGEGTIGFRHVSDLAVTTNVPGLINAPFYKASDVMTFGFAGGYMFGIIGFEVAVKHAGALAADESAIRLIQDLATDGARWSLPISLVLHF